MNKSTVSESLVSNFIFLKLSFENLRKHLIQTSKTKRMRIIIFDNFLHTNSFDLDIYFKSVESSSVGQLIKISRRNGAREVISIKTSFLDAVKNVKINHPGLDPYFVISYRKKSEMYKQNRLIILDDIQYGLLNHDMTTMEIYKMPEDHLFVHLKGIVKSKLGAVNELIRLGGEFAPSLINISYNAENRFREKSSNDIPHLEISNIEYESKSVCAVDGAHSLMYSYISNGGLPGFEIQQKYSYLLQRRLIIKYCVIEGVVYKFVYSGVKKPKIVFKNLGVEPLETSIKGLLKRDEIEGTEEVMSSMPPITLGNINSWSCKIKKVFWVKNTRSGRLYHIAFDKFYCGARSLMQMEVEYAGILGASNDRISEEAILRDISDITSSLRSAFLFLCPTTQRKQEWVLDK